MSMLMPITVIVRNSLEDEPTVKIRDLADGGYNGTADIRDWMSKGVLSDPSVHVRSYTFRPGTISDRHLEFPFLHDELRAIVRLFGFDPDVLAQVDAGPDRAAFIRAAEVAINSRESLTYKLRDREEGYATFVKAQVVPRDLKDADQVMFYLHGGSYVTEPDPFGYTTVPTPWAGFKPTDATDCNPNTIEGQLDDELSQFIEDGDSTWCTDVDELVAFMARWYKKHGLDPDWESKPDVEAPEAPIDDPELVEFLARWNAKQEIVAHFADTSRVVLASGLTRSEIAETLRDEIADLKQQLALANTLPKFAADMDTNEPSAMRP